MKSQISDFCSTLLSRIGKASIFLTIGASSFAQTQMRTWTLPPSKVHFPTSTSSALPLATTGQYRAANGAYDASGNLLFYVENLSVYQANGNSIGTLQSYLDVGGSSSCGSFLYYNVTQKEIVIVPKEGSCNQYYIIWLGSNFCKGGFALRYATVTVGSTPTLTENSPNNTSYVDFVNGGKHAGMAISKKDGSGVRKLYVVTNLGSRAYNVSSSGISASSAFANWPATFPYDHYVSDVDLSHDGSKIAWGSVESPRVASASINTTTKEITASTAISVAKSSGFSSPGVEFTSNGDLFYNVRSGGAVEGVYKVLASNISNLTATQVSTSTTITNSHIELGYDGLLYMVNTSGQLTNFNTSTYATSVPYAITVTSNEAVQYDNQYSLPDQVDGEDYTTFRGIGKLTVPDPIFKSNGVDVIPVSGRYTVNNCNAFTITSTASNYQTYSLSIYASNSSGSMGTQLYASGAVAAAYPNAQDVGALGSTNMHNTPGWYRVDLRFSNGCDADILKANAINAQNQSSFTAIGVNNNGVAATQTSGAYNVYNCQSINLIPTSANITQYRITLQSSNSSGGVVTGPGTLNYVGSWVTGSAAGVDLRTLSSNYLLSNTGYYLATLDLKDNCNPQTTRTALLNVSSLSAASSDFQFNYGDGTLIPIPVGQTYANPISTGQGFVAVNATLSTGYLDYYWMKIEKLNASNGSVISTLCNTPAVTNIPGKNSSTLGSIAINPYMSNKCSQAAYYLTQPANVNQVYRLTFTVGNTCGSSSKVGYFTNVDANYRLAEGEATMDNSDVLNAQGHNAFPNPSNGNSTVHFVLENASNVSMTIRDAQGNVVRSPLQNINLSAGEHLQNVDLTALPDGLYYYQLKTDKEITGKIVKAGK